MASRSVALKDQGWRVICAGISSALLVPKKGLEPPHPCGYMDLNHARLPIPPLRQVTVFPGERGRLEGRYRDLYSYKAETECQTGCAIRSSRTAHPSRNLDEKV